MRSADNHGFAIPEALPHEKNPQFLDKSIREPTVAKMDAVLKGV